jgi:hypothetical protein
MTSEQARFLTEMYLDCLENEAKTMRRCTEAIPEDRRNYNPTKKARSAYELACHLVSCEAWFFGSITRGDFDYGGRA